MGCGSSQNENQSERIVILKKIKSKVLELIKNNPFFNISIKDFNNFMEEESKKNNSIEEISKNIITEFFEEEENIIDCIFKNVAKFSYSKLRYIFKNDKEINILIFYFIYIFLTGNQKGRNQLLYEKIKKLLEKIKINEANGKWQFRSGKFSFLFLNLIQFYTFSFIYFFCGPAILEITTDFKKIDLEIIFSNGKKAKKYEPSNINKLLNDYLYSINNNVQPNIINYIILTDVLQPMSDYIMENKDEEIFFIESEKLNEILDVLIEKLDHNYYLEFIFNIEKLLEKKIYFFIFNFLI